MYTSLRVLLPKSIHEFHTQLGTSKASPCHYSYQCLCPCIFHSVIACKHCNKSLPNSCCVGSVHTGNGGMWPLSKYLVDPMFMNILTFDLLSFPYMHISLPSMVLVHILSERARLGLRHFSLCHSLMWCRSLNLYDAQPVKHWAKIHGSTFDHSHWPVLAMWQQFKM